MYEDKLSPADGADVGGANGADAGGADGADVGGADGADVANIGDADGADAGGAYGADIGDADIGDADGAEMLEMTVPHRRLPLAMSSLWQPPRSNTNQNCRTILPDTLDEPRSLLVSIYASYLSSLGLIPCGFS